jgi:hypothetical protein
MGQLAQPGSIDAHPVRRTRSAWRLVPVALGTAAVLAGCGAGGHRAPSAAVSAAHEHPTISQTAATGQTGPGADVTVRRSSAKHSGANVTVRHSSAKHSRANVTVRRSSAKHSGANVTVRHSSAKRGPRVAASSAHQHLAISQAAVTSQIGPGPHVTIQRSSTKRSGANVRTATPRLGATIRVITGTHNANIGTLAEGASVFLVWTASAAPIQIFTSQGNLLLSSHARTGRIRLAEGQYRGLRVASPGAWTLRLHAAV